MAINQSLVDQILLNALVAGTSMQILPEGSDTKPTVGDDHLKGFSLPGGSNVPGVNSQVENMTGIYQVNVYTPKSKYRRYNREKTNEIKSIYPAGRIGSSLVIVEKVELSGLMTSGDFLMAAVSVYYRVVG